MPVLSWSTLAKLYDDVEKLKEQALEKDVKYGEEVYVKPTFANLEDDFDVFFKNDSTNFTTFDNTNYSITPGFRLRATTTANTQRYWFDSLFTKTFFCDARWEISTMIDSNSTQASNRIGPALGFFSMNPSHGSTVFINVQWTENPSMRLWMGQYKFNGISAVKTLFFGVDQMDITADHTYKLTLRLDGNLYTAILENYTTNQRVLLEHAVNAGTGPNAAKLGYCTLGGTFDYYNLTYKTLENTSPQFLCMGDSKTRGSHAIAFRSTWPQRLNALNSAATTANASGGGDRTEQVLQHLPQTLATYNPRYAILCIGRNDVGHGVNESTWKARYLEIVDKIKADNIDVIHLLPLPENTLDQSVLKEWILATFPTDHKIDASVGWTSGMLHADGVHPSAAGMLHIATTVNDYILSKKLLSANPEDP